MRSVLEGDGWIYRGDAGDDGGLVFVLESHPRHRVAHLHVVRHGAPAWRDYLAFRDFAIDHRAYTSGKSETVQSLLRSRG